MESSSSQDRSDMKINRYDNEKGSLDSIRRSNFVSEVFSSP
jgi:hypothetical protein